MIDMKKQYRTRDGRDVRILCVDGPNPKYPVLGIIGNERSVCFWTNTGNYNTDGLFTVLDLIEVKPKIVVERWVNIFQYKNYNLPRPHIDWFNNFQGALDAYYNPDITVLARAVPFKWEGEG